MTTDRPVSKSMINRLSAGALTVWLACAPAAFGQTTRAAEDARLRVVAAAQNSSDFRTIDIALIRTHPHRARRRGPVLELALAGKQWKRFRDFAPKTDEAARIYHELVADLPSRHAFLVAVRRYESTAFLLVDDRTGRSTELSAPPRFGPGESDFVTIDNDEENDAAGVEIWRRLGDHAVRVFAETLPGKVSHETAFVRWIDPDRIELAFSCDVALCPDLTQDKLVMWRGALIRSGRVWRLVVDWPTANAGG